MTFHFSTSQRYSGRYCECDNESCDRANELLCADHGTCDCGNCKCDPGWEGSNCACSTNTVSYTYLKMYLDFMARQGFVYKLNLRCQLRFISLSSIAVLPSKIGRSVADRERANVGNANVINTSVGSIAKNAW